VIAPASFRSGDSALRAFLLLCVSKAELIPPMPFAALGAKCEIAIQYTAVNGPIEVFINRDWCCRMIGTELNEFGGYV
jgi:hypothetical protein